jgi:hypothetical protein
MWFRQITKYVTKYDTKNDVNPHSTKQDTLLIAFLIRSESFHTGHVVAHVVLRGLLLRFGP